MKTKLISLVILAMASFVPAQQAREHAHASPNLPTAKPTIWKPALNTSWQWQLSTPVDQTVNVAMYDIDMFDNHASVVASLHTAGHKVTCYIDVGTWENWRPTQ